MSSRGDLEAISHSDASTCSRELANLLARGPAPNPERLVSVIFDDIVPRLHTLHHGLSTTAPEHMFSRAEITEFGALLIEDDGAGADRFVMKMRAGGRSEDMLCLGLMAETARHLGALWEEDRCSFVDVTIGVARLQKMLCAIGGLCEAAAAEGHRVLLCALAGESHVFGVDMVACFMRQASWDVDVQKGVEAQDVAGALAGERFAVLGFTLSAESGLEGLCRAIKCGRAASVNPSIAVLVGGPLFRAQPALVAQVGADAMAADAASASLLAKRLMLRQPRKLVRHDFGAASHGQGCAQIRAMHSAP
jgi:methanogenic corrinoid protein MtbC1